MAIQTRAALLAVAELIRDATVPGENTALRVGGYCVNLLDSILLQSEVQTPSVKCVATSNVTPLSGLTTTADGVTADTDGVDAILLTAQSTASLNGPWVVHSGSWTRPVWFPTNGNGGGQWVTVQQGTLYADTEWQCTTNNPSAVIGTNNLTWRRQDAVSYDSSNDLTIGGNANCASISSRCATGGSHSQYVNNALVATEDANGFSVYNPSDATDYALLTSGSTNTDLQRVTNGGTAFNALRFSATTIALGDVANGSWAAYRVKDVGYHAFEAGTNQIGKWDDTALEVTPGGVTAPSGGVLRLGGAGTVHGLVSAADAEMLGIYGTSLYLGSIAFEYVFAAASISHTLATASGTRARVDDNGIASVVGAAETLIAPNRFDVNAYNASWTFKAEDAATETEGLDCLWEGSDADYGYEAGSMTWKIYGESGSPCPSYTWLVGGTTTALQMALESGGTEAEWAFCGETPCVRSTITGDVGGTLGDLQGIVEDAIVALAAKGILLNGLTT